MNVIDLSIRCNEILNEVHRLENEILKPNTSNLEQIALNGKICGLLQALTILHKDF